MSIKLEVTDRTRRNALEAIRAALRARGLEGQYIIEEHTALNATYLSTTVKGEFDQPQIISIGYVSRPQGDARIGPAFILMQNDAPRAAYVTKEAAEAASIEEAQAERQKRPWNSDWPLSRWWVCEIPQK